MLEITLKRSLAGLCRRSWQSPQFFETQTARAEGTINYAYSCGNLPSAISRGGEQLTFGYDGTLLTSIKEKGVESLFLTYHYNALFLFHFREATNQGQKEFGVLNN